MIVHQHQEEMEEVCILWKMERQLMGWALRKRRKNTRFSEKQIRLLVDIYEEGEKTEKKKDVATVADMMRHAQGADQQKLCSPAEY